MVREFSLPTSCGTSSLGCEPYNITLGADSNLWFTELTGSKIGRITTAGVIKEFPIPTPGAGPVGITQGPDKALWFIENNGSNSKIGHITTKGVIREFPLPTPNASPFFITPGPDKALVH